MTRQEIVDEIVLKRDSKDPFDVQRVEELREMLVQLDLDTVIENTVQRSKDEIALEELSEKYKKFKKTIKVSILILAILFLIDTVVGIVFTLWALLGLIPLGLAMILIYFCNRQKLINMEVEITILEDKPRN
ncbi:MAG: hypothetical protein MJ248_01830 [Bacilli bacterium]|nr:hypothetical protein [Bacilli bacterium]